ncbi:hypothetical protein [Cyclobacterium xiamenense]|uniref:hypothetical protein n=1 Tax=Cyclobacterium xiamenense TaxID=1297121 RepID=UPI0035CF3740
MISLIPFLLLEGFIIENIQEVFKIDTKSAFWFFKILYFAIPPALLLIGLLFQFFKPNIKEKFLKKTMIDVGVFLLLLFLLSIFSLHVSYGIFLFVLLFIFVLASILLIETHTTNIKDSTIPSEDQRNNKENVYKIKTEFYSVIGIIVLFLSFYYFLNKENSETVEKDKTPIAKTTCLYSRVDFIREHLKKEPTSIHIEPAKIGNSIEVDLGGARIFQVFRYSSFAREYRKKINEEWTDYLRYVVFNGVLILFAALLFSVITYYQTLLYCVSNNILDIDSNSEDKDVKIPANEFLSLMRLFIITFTVLIIPAYYSTNFEKDVYKSPYLNFTREKSEVFDISVNIPIDDASIKYLEAIWSEQQYFQHRFYNPFESENLVRWRGISENENKKNISEIFNKLPTDRKNDENEVIIMEKDSMITKRKEQK